jgi:hypothetical protein
MTSRIHINQHIIKRNQKTTPDKREPPVTVKTYKDNRKAFEVEVLGASKIIYRPDKPLSCGATVWVETKAPVIIDQEGG